VPAFFSEALWLLPFCVMGIWAPGLYVGWRRKVHRSHRLRCDWLGPPN
jgi:hypothetical protein